MTPPRDRHRHGFLRWVAYLVPRAFRDDWSREWAAEMNYAQRAITPMGPIRHALALRLHDLDTIRQDVLYALRGMATKPGFSLAVVLTLAVGIGANAGVFALINTVLLRPLPVSDADRIYLVFEQDSSGTRQLASYPGFLDWHDQAADVFAGLAFVRGTGLSFRSGDETSFVLASFVSDEYFGVFRVRPHLGRLLVGEDFREGAPPSVVVSHDVWVNALGSDTNAVGETVRVDEVIATVVGVLPESFHLPQWAPSAGNGIWMPMHTLPAADRAALMQRDFHADSRVVGRLRDDVSLSQAQTVMDAVAQRLAAAYPASSRRWSRVSFIAQRNMLVGSVAPRLYLLGAAVVAVLLICCVNLANLFLSRGSARAQEFAIRTAIGAGRSRVFRQLMTESLLLCGMGAMLGTSAAILLVNILRVRLPAALPRLNELRFDWRLPVVSFGLAMLMAVVFALVSLAQAKSTSLSDFLRQSTSPTSRSRSGRMRRVLITVQIAMSMVLLVGAALLVRSLMRLWGDDPGFDPHGVAAVTIQPRLPQYLESEAARALYDRIAVTARAIPGIDAVGLVNHAPFGGGSITSRASRTGDPRTASDETVVFFRTVSPGYFELMRIPVLEGRGFTEDDARGPTGPLVVNETFARTWGNASPVGQFLGVLKASRDREDFGEPILGSVVGVVGDIDHFGPDGLPSPVVYVPYTHNVWSQIVLVARTSGEAGLVLSDLEDAVRSVEPGIPLDGLGLGVYALRDLLWNRLAPRRINTLLVAGFAIAALALAAIGVYGVTSYTVATGEREIGIRLALGARPGGISGLFVLKTIRLVGVGLAIGVVAGLALTRLMQGLLFQTQPADPATFVVVAVVLFGVAALAAYVPARRAATVDPISTLKG